MSTRPFHGGNTENEGFYTDEHGIYLYINGKTPVHTGVITERTVSVGPYTVDSRMATDVRGCPQMNKIFLGCVDIRGHTVTGRVLSGINPYTSMLVYRKYLYTDGPDLYTVTSVATRHLPVYTRNQYG